MEVENQQFWNYYYDFMNRKKEKFYVMVKNDKSAKIIRIPSLFSVVSQKSALFLGDIVQNIDLEGKADRQKLNEVLRKSGVKKYLQRFPEKEKHK